jgi:hypothetical protein
MLKERQSLKGIAAILLLLVLGACVGMPKDVAKFTVVDLERALVLAEGDTAATNCWSSLLPYAEAAAERDAPDAVGAASKFQKVRNLRRALRAGIPEEVGIACAPLVVGTQKTILRLLTGRGLL